MNQRTHRSLIQKTEVLEKLKRGRAGAIQVRTEAKIGSPEYGPRGPKLCVDASGNASSFCGDFERMRSSSNVCPASGCDFKVAGLYG